jgi:lysophospholipase L1-like esterase
VQWNNGQWDVCRMPDGRNLVPLDQYVAMQMRIASILRGRARRLIFATTTPVHPDMLEAATVNPRCNEDITAYNAAAAEALGAMGVQIVDLFSPLHEDVMKYIREDRVHLTPAGVDRCADLVAAAFANGA